MFCLQNFHVQLEYSLNYDKSRTKTNLKAETPLSVYHALLSSTLSHGSIIWGQNSNNHIKRIETIQNKAIRTINFATHNAPTDILYKNSISNQIKLRTINFATHNASTDILYKNSISNQIKLRTINFATHNALTDILYKNSKILKFTDGI